MGKYVKISIGSVILITTVLLSQNCSGGFQSRIASSDGSSLAPTPSPTPPTPTPPVVGEGESRCVSGVLTAEAGENPWCDQKNVYRYLKREDGACLSPDPTCSTHSVKQFKVSELGYVGLSFGLPGSIQVQIDIDGDGAPENITKYSGSLGTYTSYHQPVAVTHVDASSGSKKTYFVYSGPVQLDGESAIADTDLDSTPEFARADGKMNALGIYIGEYDHQTKMVSRPRLVHVKDVSDPHDNAVVNVDNEGYVYVMVAARASSRGAFLYRSRDKNSIADFIHLTPKNLSYSANFKQISGYDLFTDSENYRGFAYPQLYWIEDGAEVGGGHFFLIYTVYCNHVGAGPTCTGTRQIYSAELLLNSQKTKVEIQNVRPLLAYGGHYAVSYAKGKTIVLAANIHYKGNVDNRTNLYFMYSEDAGKTWWAIDKAGNPSQINKFPLNTDALMDQVVVKKYFAENEPVTRRIFMGDISFYYDAKNKIHPVILYVGSVGATSDVPAVNGDRYLALAYLENGIFTTTRLSNDIDHNYSSGFIQATSQNGILRIYFPFTSTATSASADPGSFRLLNLPFIDAANSVLQNNALAGGRVASMVVNLNTLAAVPGEGGKVVQFQSPQLANLNSPNYLTTMCEFNYLRPAYNSSPNDSFVGVVAAGNQYQMSGANNIPNNPIFIIDTSSAAAKIEKLPMRINTSADQVPKANDFTCQ